MVTKKSPTSIGLAVILRVVLFASIESALDFVASAIVAIGLYIAAKTKNKVDDNVFSVLSKILDIISVFKKQKSKESAPVENIENIVHDINKKFKTGYDEGDTTIYRSDTIGGDK